jgi:hypothetical protein
MALYGASEVPELFEWCTLRRDDDHNDDLPCHQETHGKLAKPLERPAHAFHLSDCIQMRRRRPCLPIFK